MSATMPHATTAVEEVLIMTAGRVRSVSGWGTLPMSGVSSGADVAGLAARATGDGGATTDADAVGAGDRSIKVPAGLTSRASCAQDVRIAPTIADFHRSSDAA